jgi:hypothetical protein
VGCRLAGSVILAGILEHWQMLLCRELPKALLRFQHARGSPVQSHLLVPPALHILAYQANDAVHAFYDAGAGQRPAQVWRQAKLLNGQNLVRTLEDRLRDARGLRFNLLGEVADQTRGFQAIVVFPGLTKGPVNTGIRPRRKPVQGVPGLLDLTALNVDLGAEVAADGYAQRLGAIDHEEPADIEGEVPVTKVNEVFEKRLNNLGVFGRALPRNQRMLLAVNADAHRSNHEQVLVKMHSIDLEDQVIEIRDVGRYPGDEVLFGQRCEPPGSRRFRKPRAICGGTLRIRQTHRLTELAHCHVQQRPVHRSRFHKSGSPRGLPGLKGDLLVLTVPDPRSVNIDRATVKADLSPGCPPVVAAFSGVTPLSGTKDIRGVFLEHLHQALDALFHLIPSHFLHLRDAGGAGERIDGFGSVLHGVSVHIGLNTPSPCLEENNANLTQNFYIDREILPLSTTPFNSLLCNFVDLIAEGAYCAKI